MNQTNSIGNPFLSILWLLSVSGLMAVPAGGEGSLQPQAMQADVRILTGLIEDSHPDPYIKGGGKIAYHRRLQNLLHRVSGPSLEKEDFFKLLLPFVASIGDGHTRVLPPWKKEESHPGGIPLRFKVIATELVVDAVTRSSDVRLIGSRLISVAGIGKSEIVKRQGLLYGFENEYHLLSSLAGYNALWWMDDLHLLLPEWHENERISLSLRLPEGDVVDLTLPIPKKVSYPPVTRPSKIELPDVERSAMNFNFIGRDKKVALLRVDHMSGFRERFEILRSMGRSNIIQSAEHFYRQYQHRPPPADQNDLISGLPSATELFLELLKEMEKRGCRELFVDLRRNNGGSSAMAEILVYLLFGEKKLQELLFEGSEITKFSRLYFRLHGGESLEKINMGREYGLTESDYDFSEDRAFSGNLPEEVQRARMQNRIASMPSFEKVFKNRKRYSTFLPDRIMVICSGETFSSGFTFLRYLISAGAKSVGSTSGQSANCFGSIQEFELPNSGLCGYISHKYFQYFPEGSPQAKVLKPDFEISLDICSRYQFDPNSEILYALDIVEGNQIR